MIKVLVFFFIPSFVFAHYAKIGDEYNRIDAKKNYLNQTKEIKNLIDHSALVNVSRRKGLNRGSAFYIGNHHGRELFLTNHHVMSEVECKNAKITMSFSNKKFTLSCKRVILSLFTEEDSDITVFETSRHENLNKLKGLKIDFDWVPIAKTKLAFAGFGMKNRLSSSRTGYNNRKLKSFKLKLSMDDDCILLSPTNKTVEATDIYAKNLLITGCDMASGDSGSALIDRSSGKVVGLVFGSTDSKFSISSFDLQNKAGKLHEIFWQIGSYAFHLKRYKDRFEAIGIVF